PLPGGSGKTALPIITGSGVKRDKGHIGVVALTTIEVKGDKTEGAHTIDARDLPPEILGMTTQPVLLAYRYVQPDFNIGLNIGKHEDIDVLLTVIDRSHITIMQTLDGRRIARAVYNVKNNRNQFLRLTMPENAEVWSVAVAGKSIQPAIDNDGRLLLPLVRSVGKGGMSTFPVEIIYAENGVKPDDKGRGEEHIDMPICSEPVMHMMVSLYVPDQGKYSSFEGTLRNVERFTHIDQAYDNMPVNASEQVLRQAVNIKIREHTGEQPGEYRLDINLPISGKSYQFEKILVVKDPQWLSYKYKNLVY
nr:hypothetical protein [Spirochaetota bacterium]